MIYSFIKTIKPSDVYRSQPIIPAGKRVIAFHPPVWGEIFMDSITHTIQQCLNDWPKDQPRLILEDCPPPPEDWWE